MSLIHEALKKAEQQRRLGEPPTLGTPFAHARRQRSLLPYLAAGIVVALGAGWFLSRGNAPDRAAPNDTNAAAKPAAGSNATAPATPAAANGVAAAPATDAASSAAGRRPTMGSNAVANTNVVSTLAPPPRLNNQAMPATNPPTVKEVAERESEPHPPGANPLAPGEAAPLALGTPPPETPVNDAEGLATKAAVKEKELAGNAAPPAAQEPGRSPFIKERPAMPAATAKPSAGAAPAAQTPPSRPGFVPPEQKVIPGADTKPAAAPPVSKPPPAAAATPPPPAATPSPPAAAAAATPALEQLPAYWQLPYNVRKELPDLKMSMHVYSPTPAQRFVVLNGNRQVEGDELGGDVHVSEIRSDGVVLIFQGQRFIVPRGGS